MTRSSDQSRPSVDGESYMCRGKQTLYPCLLEVVLIVCSTGSVVDNGKPDLDKKMVIWGSSCVALNERQVEQYSLSRWLAASPFSNTGC